MRRTYQHLVPAAALALALSAGSALAEPQVTGSSYQTGFPHDSAHVVGPQDRHAYGSVADADPDTAPAPQVHVRTRADRSAPSDAANRGARGSSLKDGFIYR